MGLVAPQLAYKTAKCSGVLTVADRWFASSQIHHGCTSPDGTPCRLQGKGRIDKHLLCPVTGEVVDRDRNAALNLRDWPDNASRGPVGTTAPSAPGQRSLSHRGPTRCAAAWVACRSGRNRPRTPLAPPPKSRSVAHAVRRATCRSRSERLSWLDTRAYSTTPAAAADAEAAVLTRINRPTRSAGTGNVPSRNQR